jgi:flavodoxin
MMESIMPVLAERDDIQFESTEVTENKLYMKMFFRSLESQVTDSSQVNDIIRGGLMISNSETGNGSVMVSPMTYRLVCTNGMISPTAMRKYHVGKGQGTDYDKIQVALTDETKRASDEAHWRQVRDIIAYNLRPDVFQAEINRYNDAAKTDILGDTIELVDNVSTKYQFNEDQKKSVLDHLIKGGDLSQWGIANAVTRTAEDQQDYDEATRFESVGGKIIHLKSNEWKQLDKQTVNA